MKGKFIVFDGLDGSGKATQTKLLVDYLKTKKIKTEVVDFPQYQKTFFGNLVSRYLKGEFGGVNEVSPYLCALTYSGDRWQAKPKMEKTLKSGKILIANRYVSSNLAFMGAKIKLPKERERFFEWLQRLEYQIYGIPREDLLVYLSIPPKVGQRLVLNKGCRKYLGNKNKYDIHEANLKYLGKVQKIYLNLVKRFPHWRKIDCLDKQGKLMSKQEIHRLIVKILLKRKIVI
ncbi:MAG TPA: thymidylate kinase [Candidatus Bathyarchaeia archaeon]|nr:thymidylate kinase [Candidatus Bathyarchaeia archaeon]